MPETRYGEMAGTGIIKSGTMISVDPVQKLRIVTVTERLTVPDDSSDRSAASVGYVKKTLSQTGNLTVVGDGLSVANGVVSVNQTLDLKRLILTQTPELPHEAATVAFVENSISDKVSKTYVDFGLEDIRESYVTRDYVEDALAELSTQASVKRLLSESDATLRDYVNTEVATLARASDLEELNGTTKELASFTYVDSAIGKLASLDEVEGLLDAKVSNEDLSVLLAEKYVSKGELSEASANLSTKAYVDDSMSNLIDQTQLNNATVELASKDYVDNSLAGLATTAYVDSAVTTCKCRMGGTQYVRPADGDTIHVSSNTSYVLIDAESRLDTLTVDFSGFERNGSQSSQSQQSQQSQQVTLATSRDIENVTFAALPLSGDIQQPQQYTFTAGNSLRFVFAPEPGVWFIL